MKPNLAALNQNLVENWNARHPIGTPVTRYKLIAPLREPQETKTRSAAWLMGGHSAMVMVEGVSGGVLVESVQPLNVTSLSGQQLDRICHKCGKLVPLCGDGVMFEAHECKRKTIDDVKPVCFSPFDIQLQETIAQAKALEQSIRLLAQLAKDDATIDNTHATRIATVILHGAQDVASDLSDFLKR